MLSSRPLSIVSALVVGALFSQMSVVAVNTTFFNPASNVPEGFKTWLNQIVYPLTESKESPDGQRFVNTFAGKGEQGTFIIGPNVYKGADQILSVWTNVPKAVKGLEHFPTDVSWDGGAKYAVFGLVKYAQLDGGCSQRSYVTQFVFDSPGVYDGHLLMYHDWLSNCGPPGNGNLDCNATWV
ncbi:hypothetical protein B0J17DRAFT_732416 [Rhizoctonia solani]|nr:hypothetical protein B0J17DRAFT_732416 [Rhizoctonia solani]